MNQPSEAIPVVNFGAGADFALGVEEELVLVDPETHALAHGAVDVLRGSGVPPGEGGIHPEAYAALVELVSRSARTRARPWRPSATCAASCTRRARWRSARAYTRTEHSGTSCTIPSERYRLIGEEMRGLLARTPTCALHVHVGMPDAEAAIRAFNGLRAHLPLLQALAANSPFWYGRDSGLASARAHVFRALPPSEIPPEFASFDEYAERVEALVDGRRDARLHLPVVGHPPAPGARHARGEVDGQPVLARRGRGPGGAGPRARAARRPRSVGRGSSARC